MIHLFAFMDIEIGLGCTIYSDETIQISEELIWPMICAINNFVQECTKDATGLKNAVLEDVKIYLYSPISKDNPLKFVFFTDVYDNLKYLELKGQHIYQLLADYLDIQYFNPPEDVLQEAIAIAKYTQNFKYDEIIDEQIQEYIDKKIKNLEVSNTVIFAELGIGDIDAGIVYSFINRPEIQEKEPEELFGQLLATFGIEDELVSYSTLNEEETKRIKEYAHSSKDFEEGWYLKQIGGMKSDFWLFSYMFVDKEKHQMVQEFLDWLAKELEKNSVWPYNFMLHSFKEKI